MGSKPFIIVKIELLKIAVQDPLLLAISSIVGQPPAIINRVMRIDKAARMS